MIRIAVVGVGGMGRHHVAAFSGKDGCEIVAICDVDMEQAKSIAAEIGAKAYDDLDLMINQVEIDAISNCTPDRFHLPVSLKALRAGKHVLCEKPLAVNHAEAVQMEEAAREAGLVNMVNFSYRSAPAIQKARQIVSSGELGRIVHVEASYFQSWLTSRVWGDWRTSPAWLWRLSTEYGSQGTLGDIGVHILDFASFPVGGYTSVQCSMRTFDKAEGGRIGSYTLDANDTFAVHAEFENGAMGVIQATRWATGYQNRLALHLFGDKGAIRIDLDRSPDQLDLCTGPGVDEITWKTIDCEPTPDNYDRFLSSIRTGQNDQPDFARGAIIQKVLDACFASNESGAAVSV